MKIFLSGLIISFSVARSQLFTSSVTGRAFILSRDPAERVAESGGRELATAYWATSAQGGVIRRGVVLTYLLSLVIGSH